MSISLVLLILASPLFAILAVYGGTLLFVSVTAPLSQKTNPLQGVTPPITVIIPAHYEGKGALAAARSVLEQDYAGPITVLLAIENESDNSFDLMMTEFDIPEPNGLGVYVMPVRDNRIVGTALCGNIKKTFKIDWCLERIETPLVAFLDADHRASPDWLSLSIAKLHAEGVVGVQGRRQPLSLNTLPQICDSAQNHVGNELFTAALTRAGASVFFTGTTCVFRTEAVRGLSAPDCLTEDTYLSYQLILRGEKISHEPSSGSREEMAPSLQSYVRRRRRWSHGHNQTFFEFFGRLLRAPLENVALGGIQRGVLLFHGSFYLIPLVVIALIHCYAIHTALQFTRGLQYATLALAYLLSALVCRLLTGRFLSALRDVAVLMLWIWPLVALATPLLLKQSESALYFSLVEFPYRFTVFSWLEIFCLAAPLLSLLIGSIRLRVLTPAQVALTAISYPVVLFVDISACLLGAADLLLGVHGWPPVERTFVEDFQQIGRAEFRRRAINLVFAGVLLTFSAIVINDFGVTPNCGAPRALFFKPILFTQRADFDWKYKVKKIAETGRVRFEIISTVDGPGGENAELIQKLDGVPLPEASFSFPFGFARHVLTANLKMRDAFCSRELDVTTSLLEIKGRELTLNGEPFIIKGMVPSFFSAGNKLNEEAGFRQIKLLGANTVRFYHEVPKTMRDAVALAELLIVDQPTNSNWNRTSLEDASDTRALERSFIRLHKMASADPFRLFPMLGNELELNDQKRRIPLLFDLMRRINGGGYFPYGYATYSTYVNYPSPIQAVNMLDSGKTYWGDAVELLVRYDKPILAGELGGIVAFTERTSHDVRSFRLRNQWQQLLKQGFVGAFIYESHDNWAQPVPSGFNDPFTPEQPDDERGLWTRENGAKPILRVVEDLFSDLEVEVTNISGRKGLVMRNRRRFSLAGIRSTEKKIKPIALLRPGEEITLNAEDYSSGRALVQYTTHSGQSNFSNITLPSLNPSEPEILSTDFEEEARAPQGVRGKLIRSGEIRFLLPESWKAAEVNNQRIENTDGVLIASVENPVAAVNSLEVKNPAGEWRAYDGSFLEERDYEFRFRLKPGRAKDSLLVLGGLGARQIEIHTGKNGRRLKRLVHKYREEMIPLSELEAPEGEFIYLTFTRSETHYITSQYHPFGEKIDAQFEVPWTYYPTPIEIRKAE